MERHQNLRALGGEGGVQEAKVAGREPAMCIALNYLATFTRASLRDAHIDADRLHSALNPVNGRPAVNRK